MTIQMINFQVAQEGDYSSFWAASNASIEVDWGRVKSFAKRLLIAQKITGGTLMQKFSDYNLIGFFDEENQDVESEYPFTGEVVASADDDKVTFDFRACSEHDEHDALYAPDIIVIERAAVEETVAGVPVATDGCLDIETMDNKTSSVITAIGFSAWNFTTGDTVCEYHARIDWRDALKRYPQFTMSDDTVKFWEDQSDEARQELSGERGIEDVLTEFCDWFKENCPDAKVLGNGPSFDVSIMEYAFDVVGMKAPWHFRNIEDVRTVVSIGRRFLKMDPKYSIPFQGVKHNALDDARHESEFVRAIYKELGERLL
jgi:hypothetical protein